MLAATWRYLGARRTIPVIGSGASSRGTARTSLLSPLVSQRADPILPLSFTSAFAPRQFQIGLKNSY